MGLRILLLAVVLFPAFGCKVSELPNRRDTRDSSENDIGPVDVVDEVDSGPDGLCDPEFAGAVCGPGEYCETTARVCVECVARTERCVGEPGRTRREVCETPRAQGLGEVEGGTFESTPCPSGQVCVPKLSSTVEVECRDKICEAGYSTCVSGGKVKRCNDAGTEETIELCTGGRACYEGACEPIRHNVMLIFDTSGSMWSYLDKQFSGTPFTCRADATPCMENFPTCDAPENPLTLLTLSKRVFYEVIDQAIGGYAQYALARFPQYESPINPPGCMLGWYGMTETITGDAGERDTSTGTWFEDYLHEVLAVPFPSRTTLSNLEALQSWLDNTERLGATSTACTVNTDCGPLGKCGNFNGEKRCFVHTDPELRASGQTPLGKSLFYAGEYFRRFVRVDGKPCSVDADCRSAGYSCVDSKCMDPYRHCKDDYIILFTDGDESQFVDENEFFNPVVQAKRLAFGLDCTTDADCRGGATCAGTICVPPDTADASLPITAGGGFGALSTLDGAPLSIRTTVITLDGIAGRNRRIALAGGGAHVDVTSGDPQTFKQLLLGAMSPSFKCLPEDLEAIGTPSTP